MSNGTSAACAITDGMSLGHVEGQLAGDLRLAEDHVEQRRVARSERAVDAGHAVDELREDHGLVHVHDHHGLRAGGRDLPDVLEHRASSPRCRRPA